MERNTCIFKNKNGNPCRKRPNGMPLDGNCICMDHTVQISQIGFYEMLNLSYQYRYQKEIREYKRLNPRINTESLRDYKIRLEPTLETIRIQFLDDKYENLRNEVEILNITHGTDVNELSKDVAMAYIHEHNNLVIQADILQQRRTMERLTRGVRRNTGELERLANDTQNVHTTTVVEHVKKMLNLLFSKYSVSDDETNSLKTLCEIENECTKLTTEAKICMTSKYITSDNIYDLGDSRVYARTLIAVWKYIQDSPNKNDLINILIEELHANVGMCAQGNLTRILNVLSGYLDGIGPEVKSNLTMLNEEFLLLRKIQNQSEKTKKANALLKKYNVPKEQWSAYIDNI